ncbi:MAG: hypothetical protein IJL98_04155 [Lachnospiraceae bacterium]|nr:hypothetical protein [Lachnospiraceae bacterium]
MKQNSGGGSVDVSGKVIIRNNDGAGTMDNLVLQVNACLYDQGLTAGSEVHLRSTSDDAVSLSDPNMTEAQRKTGNSYRVDKYQLRYFVSDHKLLRVTDTVSGDTGLVASVFSERKTVIYITAGLAAAAVLAGAFILLKRKTEIFPIRYITFGYGDASPEFAASEDMAQIYGRTLTGMKIFDQEAFKDPNWEYVTGVTGSPASYKLDGSASVPMSLNHGIMPMVGNNSRHAGDIRVMMYVDRQSYDQLGAGEFTRYKPRASAALTGKGYYDANGSMGILRQTNN